MAFKPLRASTRLNTGQGVDRRRAEEHRRRQRGDPTVAVDLGLRQGPLPPPFADSPETPVTV